MDIDLFPGQHHAVLGEAGPELPEGTELKPDDKFQVYSRGGKSVRFLTNTFDDEGDLFGGGIAGLITGKGSAIADYFPIGGASFRLAGFEGKGGKARWKTTVWAACRQSGNGFGRHSVELTSKDNTLFVFGAETHGIYLEAFDMATGKCQFRFCSCYWFTFSETWARKD